MDEGFNFDEKTTSIHLKEMIRGLLEFDPQKRWSADKALKSALFNTPNTLLKNKMTQRMS